MSQGNNEDIKQRVKEEKAKQKAQLEHEAAFAQQGRQVLTNPAYQHALTVRKGQIFDVFCKTKADQHEVREEAWRTMQNLMALESFFDQLLTTGKMADKSLESLTEE